MHFALGTVLARYPVVPFPKLLAWHAGGKLIVTESEFVDFHALEIDDGKTLATVVRALAEISAESFPEAAHLSHSSGFGKKRHIIKKRLQEYSPRLRKSFNENGWRWQAQINSHPLVFCHGDLHRDNVSKTQFTLDWDNAGFAPYGYDAALTCRRRHFTDADALLAFCASHFERPETAARDRFAFAYFFLMMMPARKWQWDNLPLFDTLLARLPELAAAAE